MQSLNNLGVVYTSQGRVQEALGLLTAAVTSCPTYAEAYNNLGVLQVGVCLPACLPACLSPFLSLSVSVSAYVCVCGGVGVSGSVCLQRLPIGLAATWL